MNKNDYLTKEKIEEILKTDIEWRVKKRESRELEFKKSFDWKDKKSRAKYLKSISAFSNNKGGYLIFGVSDRPRTILGIDETFSSIDDADISSFINTYLGPSVVYEREEFKINGKMVGIFYVHEADVKPIICLKTYDDILSEGSIYYRYNSQSDKIKSNDLLILLNKAKEKESQKWIDLFTKVSHIGIDGVGVYDHNSGSISTRKGNKFILDEKLLRRLKVLDKYSVEEKDGAPAVKIIGQIDEVGTVITKSKYLHDNDILQDFLEQKSIGDSVEYLKAMCYQTSGMLPIYFYLKSGGYTEENAINFFNTVNKNSQAKTNIIKRISDDNNLLNLKSVYKIDAETPIGALRRRLLEEIKCSSESALNSEGQVKRYLEAIFNLEIGCFEKSFLYTKLITIVDKFYSNKNLSTLIRQAICYLDLIENRDWE